MSQWDEIRLDLYHRVGFVYEMLNESQYRWYYSFSFSISPVEQSTLFAASGCDAYYQTSERQLRV